MKKCFVTATIILAVSLLFAVDPVTQFGYIGAKNMDRFIAMMASAYTWKAVGNISDSGSVITVSTSWPRMLICQVINPRRDSSAYIHCITQTGDTAKISIQTESCLAVRPPPISKILTAGSTDSIVVVLQLIVPQ
jgi:hypothetical protein